jgi:hypothetical protein
VQAGPQENTLQCGSGEVFDSHFFSLGYALNTVKVYSTSFVKKSNVIISGKSALTTLQGEEG